MVEVKGLEILLKAARFFISVISISALSRR